MGAIFFAFQIYGDFSGYSDIAIGTSSLFGFKLTRNFAYPYFSRDIAEFWRKWHISLSTWFRDYLYIPLGGSKGNKLFQIRNVLIIFVVSGAWHGANWTFIVWGALNALYFIPLMMFGKNRSHLEVVANEQALPSLKEFVQMIFTFFLTLVAWIFFRAEDIGHAFAYLSGIFSLSLFQLPVIFPKTVILSILLFIFFEWTGRRDEYAIEKIYKKVGWVPRWFIYYFLILLIFSIGGKQQEFIYFQF